MSYIEDRIADCERYIHDLQDGLRELGERHNALLDGVGEIYNRLRLMEKEAEHVKHGRWIDPASEDCYRCSVCEEYTHMEMPRLLYHYCPNCGAKMEVTE